MALIKQVRDRPCGPQNKPAGLPFRMNLVLGNPHGSECSLLLQKTSKRVFVIDGNEYTFVLSPSGNTWFFSFTNKDVVAPPVVSHIDLEDGYLAQWKDSQWYPAVSVTRIRFNRTHFVDTINFADGDKRSLKANISYKRAIALSKHS